MRNKVFPAISITKDVMIISDSSPPGQLRKEKGSVGTWQPQQAADPPYGEP